MQLDQIDNPFLSMLGAELVVWQEGRAEFLLSVTPLLLNRQGSLQGGAISTLLDVAAGYAGLYVPDGAAPVHAATLSLSVNFLARSNEGRVRAIGIRRNTGRSIYFSDAQLLSESGIVLASAQGVFKYRAANQ